ncbi:hypothetical protein VPNG_02096 [Cytospora leucostoma]|uniref:Small nuclear ribonucleoprotein Prp3 C-terminal domain-containing protein n=1 Tax=Cytospora leucostoma TaxID=1230097 RepID=A0A423XHW3_9PEZI|nr:hypothetical protein VPNG_02096 [Cytospora leucostoma]
MAGPGNPTLLPRDLLEAQLSMVDLIRAMYPPTEDDADLTTDEVIDRVREWCESSPDPSSGGPTSKLPSTFGLAVTIPLHIEGGQDGSTPPGASPAVQMSVAVPLSSSESSTEDLAEPPPLTYSLRQPPWMSRAEVAELASEMPTDDILAAFDHIQDKAPEYYLHYQQQHNASSTQDPSRSSRPGAAGNDKDDSPLLRVWFYFPSLSTREKRKDLVSYAPGYGLTGFVLAGKPGVLCLEGTSGSVDGYMNAIKNESWGDIPSYQKKVSERFREELGEAGRRFGGMSEITDDLGERRGARRNRGDMAALEAWLKERGVGESFSRVIMGG